MIITLGRIIIRLFIIIMSTESRIVNLYHFKNIWVLITHYKILDLKDFMYSLYPNYSINLLGIVEGVNTLESI